MGEGGGSSATIATGLLVAILGAWAVIRTVRGGLADRILKL